MTPSSPTLPREPSDQGISDDRSIDPSALGRFVSLDGCPQWFQFKQDTEYRAKRRTEHDYKEAFEPLNVLLAKDGNEYESQVVEAMAKLAAEYDDHEQRGIVDWDDSKPILREQFEAARHLDPDDGPLLITQPRLGDRIEGWEVSGTADLLVCWPLPPDDPENNTDQVGLRLRVLDVKAAHEEKTYQQIQVASYTQLLRQFLAEPTDRTENRQSSSTGATGAATESSASSDTTDDTDSYPFVIEGGIVIRTTLDDLAAAEDLSPTVLPEFDLSNLEVDVRRLLQPGGQLDELWEADPEDVRYQLAPKCQGCAYREACYTEALETRSLAQFGLSANEQRALASEGIETIEDLARLAYAPEDPRAYEYKELQPRDGAVYQRLLNDAGLGDKLQTAIQQAQTVIGEIEHDHPLAANSPAPVDLYGTGNGTLPDDDPYADLKQPIERKSLIRVYLNVQQDHRYDRINAIGGYVSVSLPRASDAVPIRFGHLAPDVPDSMADADALETTILDQAVESVFDAIETIGAAMGMGRAPVHFYVYTRREYDALIEGLTRQSSTETNALRDLLGLRGAIGEVQPGIEDESKDEQATQQDSLGAWDPTIDEDEDTSDRLREVVHEQDQAMISIVQSDVEQRHALGMPSTGLLQVKDKSKASEDALARSTGWTYTRENGDRIDLREAFNRNVFDYFVPYNQTEEIGGIDLYPQVEGGSTGDETEPESDPDGFYPSRPRSGAQLPLEYVWAAHDVLTVEWVREGDTDLGNYNPDELIAPFRWIDPNTRDQRIIPEDIEAIVECFAHACAHVERAVKFKSRKTRKRPLDLEKVSSFDLGTSTTARAAAEFLALEYDTSRQEQLRTYGQPIDERIRGGNTIPFIVRDAWVEDGDTLHATGDLPYQFWFDDVEKVARACRLKGSDGTTMGSWLVANRLTRNGEPRDGERPFEIENGTGVTVRYLDLDDRTAHITASYGGGSSEFLSYHRGWTVDPAAETDSKYLFAPGQPFILDKRTDDLVGQRSFDLLGEAQNNTACGLLDALAEGSITASTTNTFDGEAIDTYLEWAGSTDQLDYGPNEEQAAFIGENTAQLALLQGPPGTGKTSGAAAHATLARVYGLSRKGMDRGLNGLVAGESNKAVDEVLKNVHDLLIAYREDGGDGLDDLELVRLASGVPEDALEHVTYLDYNEDDETLQWVVGRLRKQTTEQTLVFATPARLYKLVDKLSPSVSAEDRLAGDESYFDLLTIDEASMMRLPSFLTAGAFLHDDAQILVAGDQRQMAPVRKHEWDHEQRRTIRERAPYLSALDYCRLLRGDPINGIFSVDENQCQIAGTGTFPLYQLEESYRCHTDVAAFLRRQVYNADGISYQSAQTATVRESDPVSDGVACVFGQGRGSTRMGSPTATDGGAVHEAAEGDDRVNNGQATFDQWSTGSVSSPTSANGGGRGETQQGSDQNESIGPEQSSHHESEANGHALTLILHDERESRQSNAVEAAIGAALEQSTHEDDKLGIVTPHNAQRGLLNTHLDSVECETVERYQGGERPVIMVSATASDPDFVQVEADFLLNPNRLTVAMSRMQRGLVVVASRTVFDVVPKDIEKYEQVGIWKGLYNDLDVLDDEPAWSGQLDAFVGNTEIDLDALGVSEEGQREAHLDVYQL